MGLWSRLLRRRGKKEYEEPGRESVTNARDEVDFSDAEQRRQYVTDCLEQAADASRQINRLEGEYAKVTSLLTDMEEIEALPGEEREALNGLARRLSALCHERDRYREKKNRMRDSDFYRMRQQEEQVQEGIEKLKECESYGELVKQDMQRLDRERNAYTFRRGELEDMLNNFRGMAVIFLAALAACLVMLLTLQFGFHMKTQAGYIISVTAATVAIAVLWAKYTDAQREKGRVERALNRLILLQNKVKIRYVNNSNLQEYLHMKYNAENAASLEKAWKQYQEEKEERKEYAEAEAKLAYYQGQLRTKISNYHILDPDRWVNRPDALLDPREMVEIRHDLILQRQALRRQMDYNGALAEDSRREIMDIVKKYPAYAAEILSMAQRYEDG